MLDLPPEGGEIIRGVRVVVADTGTGMDPAVRRRIFDAFFTTKESTGTGLGLWISSEIIAKHQGTVRVRSCPAGIASGRSGTVFMLFFPLEGAASQVLRENESSAVRVDA